MFMRLDDLDGGRIMYGDIDITTYSLEEWRKMFSYTPQHPKLRNKSLLENIRYAGADVNAEDVDAVLRESGLNHAVESAFKPRYEQDRWCRRFLSGGSARSWLMRSLFQSSCRHAGRAHKRLDPASRNDVMNLIEDEIQRSMIIITHDPAVIKMDTVLEMEGGKASVRENNRFTCKSVTCLYLNEPLTHWCSIVYVFDQYIQTGLPLQERKPRPFDLVETRPLFLWDR
jgi:ABC-type transport system involved in cytochrome bd biosynthesis fused ATPase/permease subunit